MANRLALARDVLKQAEVRTGVRSVPTYEHDESAYLVPAYLSEVFPYGIARGSVIEVSGSLAICMLLAGVIAQHGGWVAHVGIPEWSWDVAHASGIREEKCVAITDAQHELMAVLSSLIDGYAVVIVPSSLVPAKYQRTLERKARTRGCVLVSWGSWQASARSIRASIHEIRGRVLHQSPQLTEIGPISSINYKITSHTGSSYVNFSGEGWLQA
ncbi:hypothetical protein JTE88_04695 [Arcanobacterium phocisimile]|uniref:Protein ImuA n=1 Tax=Arcanobacterium phocisimile TaxID=1302235 RepID=A0ABX7IEY8_9ACTO|nr:hypothetical protein [Arcanobacterium phocisimile]QRV01420.1 hypothetical protein JTE88_04695 [Arcanobacterium phocisimile]